VTDEQRSSRPIFNATLRAAASWLFFRVARSTVMIQIAALGSRLEKQPTDPRRSSRDLGDGTLVRRGWWSASGFGTTTIFLGIVGDSIYAGRFDYVLKELRHDLE
jgi:hypothetical protein